MGRFLLASGSLLLLGLALELGLRLSGGPDDAAHALYSFHQSDPVLGWIGQPNLRKRFVSREFDVIVEHDAGGFRKPEPARPAAAARHVLVLGDSFTWGSGVGQGEVYTDHLQRSLAPSVSVVNRGINGVGTAQQYLLLQRELAARRYELVLLQFTPNDVDDNVDKKRGRRPWFVVEKGELVARNPQPRPLMSASKRFFREQSRLYNLVSFRLSLLQRRSSSKKPLAERATRHEDLREQPGFEVTRELLRAMDGIAREHGAAFFVVYGHPGDPLAYASAEELCARAGVGWLDLVPALRARSGLTLTFTYNHHWTADGHRAVAEALLGAEPFVRWRAAALSAPPAADRAAGPAPARR
jgi:hypothetical protein